LYTPDSGLTHLLHGRRRSFSSISLYCRSLVTFKCTRGVINPLYHCRHSVRYRQWYEFEGGMGCVLRHWDAVDRI